MLALLANCVGHFGTMSSAFSRFWTRAAKRGQKKRAEGSLEEDCEYVRVEGRRAKGGGGGGGIEGGKGRQLPQLCWTESDGSATCSSQSPQQLTAPPLIRIEQSEPATGQGQMATMGQPTGAEARRGSATSATAADGRRGSSTSTVGSVGDAKEWPRENGQNRQQHRDSLKGADSRAKDSSFSSVELRSHRSGVSGSGPAGPVVVGHPLGAGLSGGHRPSSSIHGEADIQMCLGRPCARIRLSIQYGEQKKLLILTLHELAQIEEPWTSTSAGGEQQQQQRKEEKATTALQVRLALLTDGQQPGKVQKFQSKFHPVDQFLHQIHYGQTFAFDCAKDQLAGSVVRMRLYRKSREQRRPQCLGVAFLRNYLVDVEARKAQNHFLQFRRALVEPKSAKGSISLFPSLLSLTHSSSSAPPFGQPKSSALPHSLNSPTSQQSAASAFPASASSLAATGHQQSSMPSTAPQSASSSRRGSTVDESGRFCSLPQFGSTQPEVLVSLCYFEVQNRLMVGVDKAAALARILSGGKKEDAAVIGAGGQEVFVRIIALSPAGIERGKQKSECVRANCTGETQFNAQAYFNIPRNELAQSSVQVHLFALHGTLPLLKRKHRIGSLTLSQKSQNCSSPDAQTHWQEMIQGMGITVDKWHMLESEESTGAN